MALLNIQNKYIKLYINGEYEIYESIEDRNSNKNAIYFEDVIKKYEELKENSTQELNQYTNTLNLTDDDYKNNDKLDTLLKKDLKLKHLVEYDINLNIEYNNYLYALQCKNKKLYSYPIMEKIYFNVKESIPHVIEAGVINLKGNSLEEIYNNAKIENVFGEFIVNV